MPEMATLDAFFNKVDRPASLSAVEQQNCKSSSLNEKNFKGASRKRSRSTDSHSQTRRLQKKRPKPLDSNLNVSDHCAGEGDTPEVVSNCRSCSQVVVDDGNVISAPSPTVGIEISYEEFLKCTGIAHVETSLCTSEDVETDMIDEVKMSPVKTSSKDSVLAIEPFVNDVKKDANSHDEDEHEDGVLSNNLEIASKDIRSFFSKADKVSPEPVNAAILMKIKADVHGQQLQKRNTASKCTDASLKTGSDLARRQRAAIVITDDDLDIEVIDVSETNDDFEIDFSLEDDAVNNVTLESSTETHVFNAEIKNVPLVCNELNTDVRRKSAAERDSASVDPVTPVVESVSKLCSDTRPTKLDGATSQNVNVECSALHFSEDKCFVEADEVIVVDEKADAVECDTSSNAESSTAGMADGQSSATLSTNSRKLNQVKLLNKYVVHLMHL